MQVRIIITTIAFMLTMVLLGFYTLLEQNRMQTYTLAREGRQIEAGAELYTNNCVGCHGYNAKGANNNANGISQEQGCVNPNALPGDDDYYSCLGLPLNHYGLMCPQEKGSQTTARMNARGWPGSKEGFIKSTLISGRAGGVMAPWAQETGGPLAQNQIDNLTKYILNFENEELCSVPSFQFPWPDALKDLPNIPPEDIELVPGQEFDLDQLPLDLNGDPVKGEDLYLNTYGCTSCHGDPVAAVDPEGSGPWHGGYVGRVAERLGEEYMLNGVPATYDDVEEYTYRSILYPHEYLVEGYTAAMIIYSEDSMMSASPHDIVDLTAYLLTLE